MQIANLPANEKERLLALSKLEIIDSEEEKEFNDLAELACYICGTPVALISFIEKERQWFKSAVGTELRETPRDIAFCSHAILDETGLMVVPDSAQDNRFVDNPLVTGDSNIQFYAGVPLNVDDSFPVGTLCVLDTKPNTLSEDQKDALRRISRQVIKLLELRKKNLAIRDAADANEKLLKEEIERHTENLKHKNLKLSQLNAEMEQMVYIASHDLKEPIRKLKMYADILGEAATDEAKLKKFLPKIHSSADRAYNLVNDILDFAKINSFDLVKKPLDFNEMMESVYESNSEIISESKAVVSHANLPIIMADESQMIQLFGNLIQNAIKYCSGTPTISVSSSITEKENPREETELKKFFKIEVTDNGIGFDTSHKEKIFDFFQRLHSKEEFSGTGIGLAIVKKIAHNHGGVVKAESITGKGSVFTVYLPV